ncbi:retrotransposon protein, putative, ty3-gypsy subclass, partial [Tanacetum coccineum]
MPPRMRTQSASRLVAESRGRGTGEQVGRGRKGRGPKGGNDDRVNKLNGQGNDQRGANRNVKGVSKGVGGAPDFLTIIVQQLQNLLPAILAQVGNQGNVRNQNGNVVNENTQDNVRSVLVNGNRVGFSYKEFLACNPKEYDGKGVKYTAGSFVGKALTWWNSQIRMLSWEVVVSMSWNDFNFMMIEEFCPSHEMQKLETELWNHVMVEAGHTAYTNRFHELDRMVATTEPKTIQKAVQIFGVLNDEAVRNRSIKKVKKRGNVGEPSKDKNGRDDNKMTRTGNAFAITANPVGRENTGAWPRCTTCNSYHAPKGPCRTCFNCNRPGHFTKDCRVAPRNVNPVNVRNPAPARGACYECGSTDHPKLACPRLNRAQGPGGNRPNQVVANNRGQGRGNQENQARGRAFMLGAEEARQDLNIMTGTFTLNNHFATTLFDSGADYSFVSTTFIPLLGIEPSELGFRYEIEIASGQLVEIDKVIKGCKLEIEGHVFDIDLIPFGHGSFDVIIGMDWLSNHKAEIICHEKVVRIPLLDGKVLRVLGERPEEKARLLMSAKASDKKQEEIVVVRDFPEDMIGYSIDQKVKYTAGSFVGKALTWWISQICTLSREVAVSMSWNDFKFMMIEDFHPSHEMQKLETKLWNHVMVGAGHAAYTDRFHELARLVPHLLTPESRKIERYVYGLASQIRGMVAVMEPKTMQKECEPSNVRNPTPARGACHECGSTDHLKPACPRLNRSQGPGGNRPNQVVANNEGQGHGNQGNQATGRAFMLGAEEARQDPNIVTCTFALNNHLATTLFDYGADYSFVSTTFIPLLGIEPSELGFRYEIEIASEQLVEIDKVIKGCKLEIEGH